MHLGVGNEDACILSIKHMVSKLLELKIDTLVFAGDWFHSRSNQTESVLQASNEIFKLIDEAGIFMYFFPGNHDKTSYYTHKSFLDTYIHHPNTQFNSELSVIEIQGVTITLLPFFADELIVPMIEQAQGTDILISHFDMQGSTHLGKVCEKSSITKATLKKWDKVYLGHYHNWHEISKDITHLPSLRQSSFGEDAHKGFTIINEDLSYTHIQGVFKQFTKFILNINELTIEEIKELVETHKGSEDTIRFEFIGDENKLRALDEGIFAGSGIDVKKKYEKKYKQESTEKPVLIKKFDKTQIEDAFKEFCEEKGYDYAEGVVMLDSFLNKTK